MSATQGVGFAASTSEARRLVAQGAVRVDGQPSTSSFRFRRGINNLLEVGDAGSLR
jgi:ribosomal protein S4